MTTVSVARRRVSVSFVHPRTHCVSFRVCLCVCERTVCDDTPCDFVCVLVETYVHSMYPTYNLIMPSNTLDSYYQAD